MPVFVSTDEYQLTRLRLRTFPRAAHQEFTIVDAFPAEHFIEGVPERIVPENAKGNWRLLGRKSFRRPFDEFRKVVQKRRLHLVFHRRSLLRPERSCDQQYGKQHAADLDGTACSPASASGASGAPRTPSKLVYMLHEYWLGDQKRQVNLAYALRLIREELTLCSRSLNSSW